jgi:phycocyanobilin lyase beta subunit
MKGNDRDAERERQLILAVEQADDASSLLAAVRALAAAPTEAAIPTLIAVLGYNNASAALAAVEGLIQLGDAAVPELIAKLDGYNYGARAYGMRALAAIASPAALDVLLAAAATDFAPSVRRAAAKGLGIIRWSKLSAEQIQTAQSQALETLLQICQDPDWSIRYGAVVGLQALSSQPDVRGRIAAGFEQIAENDPEPAVRARVYLAQQAILDSKF